MPSVKYFVFAVDRHLIHLSVRKVKAIQEVLEPQNASKLQSFSSFLELVNYYRKFILDILYLVCRYFHLPGNQG